MANSKNTEQTLDCTGSYICLHYLHRPMYPNAYTAFDIFQKLVSYMAFQSEENLETFVMITYKTICRN